MECSLSKQISELSLWDLGQWFSNSGGGISSVLFPLLVLTWFSPHLDLD